MSLLFWERIFGMIKLFVGFILLLTLQTSTTYFVSVNLSTRLVNPQWRTEQENLTVTKIVTDSRVTRVTIYFKSDGCWKLRLFDGNAIIGTWADWDCKKAYLPIVGKQ
jgi:hypothetical protein